MYSALQKHCYSFTFCYKYKLHCVLLGFYVIDQQQRNQMYGFHIFKNKNPKCYVPVYAKPLSQYLVEPPFTAVTVWSPLGIFLYQLSSFIGLILCTIAHAQISYRVSVNINVYILWQIISLLKSDL
ncbi:hypothetical protein ATANTOWER_015767 [Ataeniobius toweri]|uniref:Uncharacterized protein n=1 Tax=Ataeniobius toweri TaxID=208326 RepID=A0ABU7B207_9TELE|nr:hypothetical protein [Ataeniobius toweri]